MTPFDRARAVLTDHDLPTRLIPDNVVASSWNPHTGTLTATLASPVHTTFDSIPVRYAKRVRAVVRPCHIPELHGVEARIAFWVKVTAIRGEPESLVFSVGRINKRLPLAAFR